MSAFSKKHYEKVAEALREQESMHRDYGAPSMRTAASVLAHMFEQDNPKFNRERFIAAAIGD